MRETSIKAECTSNVYNHWGRTDDPKDLTVGKEYTVDYVVIHGSYTVDKNLTKSTSDR